MKLYRTVTGYIYADRTRTPEETAIIAEINDWIQTLPDISPYDCNIPMTMEDGLENGTYKAMLISELENFDKSGYYAYISHKGKKHGEEIIVSLSCDNAKVTKLIGFVDNQNRYVGHAYVSDEEFDRLSEYDDCG